MSGVRQVASGTPPPDRVRQVRESLESSVWFEERRSPTIDVSEARPIHRRIEHTLLSPFASRGEVERVCNEAQEHNFFGVCVFPSDVSLALDLLQERRQKVISVVAFPHGSDTTEMKKTAASLLAERGADEIDLVAPLSDLRSGRYQSFFEEIAAVVDSVPSTPVKVILEMPRLNQEEKIIGALLSEAAGSSVLKTSTGTYYSAKGGECLKSSATLEDVSLLRSVLRDETGIKAAGGISTRGAAERMVQNGADRIGSSSSLNLV